MKRLIPMKRLPLLCLLACPAALLSTAALADPPGGKGAHEAAKEQRKAQHEWEKDRREHAREVDKAQREDHRERLKAAREEQKELRKARRELAKEGWYDGQRWQAYEDDYSHSYRTRTWEAIERYPAPREWIPPQDYRTVVFEPGMRLPDTWIRETYVVEHHVYELPPPPPRHQWVRVDDDVVLVALASGLIADFVYDLFE